MAVFVSDTFTEGSNVDLESHTGETGATWTTHTSFTSKLQVSAGTDSVVCQTSGSPTGTTAYTASGSPAGNEYDVEGDCVYLGTTSDIVTLSVSGRFSTSVDTHYMARHDRSGNEWQLYKVSAGSYTSLGTYSQTLTTSQVYALKLEIRDAAKKVYIDSVERISSANDDITADGKAGIRWFFTPASQTNGRLDNFVATDAAAPAGEPLTAFHPNMQNSVRTRYM